MQYVEARSYEHAKLMAYDLFKVLYGTLECAIHHISHTDTHIYITFRSAQDINCYNLFRIKFPQ